jgi:hypothetical protein
LVIGNLKYQFPYNNLHNCIKDADSVAASLVQLGFDVTLVEDAPLPKLQNQVDQFISKINTPGSIVAVYYVGHGMEDDNHKYFIVPVDYDPNNDGPNVTNCVCANDLVKKLEDTKAMLRIVILDACRKDPFAATSRALFSVTPIIGTGRGTMIAYSTSHNRVAEDGDSTWSNGPFANGLAKSLLTPGISVEDAFKRTRLILSSIEPNQVSMESTSLEGEYNFAKETKLSVVVVDSNCTLFANGIALGACYPKKKFDFYDLDSGFTIKLELRKGDSIIASNKVIYKEDSLKGTTLIFAGGSPTSSLLIIDSKNLADIDIIGIKAKDEFFTQRVFTSLASSESGYYYNDYTSRSYDYKNSIT